MNSKLLLRCCHALEICGEVGPGLRRNQLDVGDDLDSFVERRSWIFFQDSLPLADNE